MKPVAMKHFKTTTTRAKPVDREGLEQIRAYLRLAPTVVAA